MNNEMFHTYNDEFKIEGYFSNRIVSAPTNNLNGILTFSPKNKILAVHIGLNKLKFWEQQHINCIYGITSGGIYIKLINLISTAGSGNFLYEYFVNTCILSRKFFDNKNNITKKIDFSLTGFNNWFPILEHRNISRIGRKDKGIRLSILPSSVLKIGSFKNDNKKYFFKIYTNLSLPSTYDISCFRRVTIESKIGVIFSSYSSFSTRSAIKIVKEFEKLFAVITGKRHKIQFIGPFGVDNVRAIYTSQTIFNKIKEAPYTDSSYPFTYKSFNNSLNTIINSFYNRPNNINALIINYLMSLNSNLDLSNKLIDLCQAIDSYYESLAGSPRSLENRIIDFLNCLPKCLTSILKKNRKIILAEVLRKEKKGSITIKNLSKKHLKGEDTFYVWAKSIKDTRIFLVHNNSKRTKVRITDSCEKERNINILQFLIQCFILQKLGYSNFDRSDVQGWLENIIKQDIYPLM